MKPGAIPSIYLSNDTPEDSNILQHEMQIETSYSLEVKNETNFDGESNYSNIQVKHEAETEENYNESNFSVNPWDVSNLSIFLKYCCPECDFKNELYEEFSGHALENHVLATTLFVKADRLECPRLWRITMIY